jgi:hypothetical protein
MVRALSDDEFVAFLRTVRDDPEIPSLELYRARALAFRLRANG